MNMAIGRLQDNTLLRALAAAGLAGLAVSLVGVWLDPSAFYRIYLCAALFWLSLSLGSLAVLMIHEITGGPWGRLVEGVLRAAAGTLPVMALLFIPLALNVEAIFPWTAPEDYPQKAAYLNIPFFLTRTLAYFLIWLALAAALQVWRTKPPAARLRRSGALGLLLYSLTVSFFAVDWIMSLEPEWFSAAIGFVVISSQVAGALALAMGVMGIAYWRRQPPELTARFQDLANLLLAAVMFWAYVAFMQYLIIWSGNLPEEIVWYLRRSQGGWQTIAWLLILFHFVLPFALLISRRVKGAPQILVGVAGLVLFGRLVDVYWLVGPLHREQGSFALHWLDATALIGIGGLWLAVFLWLLLRQPVPSVSSPLPWREGVRGRGNGRGS